MGMEIGNTYSSYYAQVSNNRKNNVDKTSNNDSSVTNKTVSKEEYFNNICKRYSNANIYMSDSFIKKKNAVSFSFSPRYIEKAMSDPKAAENLNRLMDLIPSTIQNFSAPRYTIDGKKITNISFHTDENGGVSCDYDVEEKSSQNTGKSNNKIVEEERLRRRKLEKLKEEKLEELKKNKNSNKTSSIGYGIYNNIHNIKDLNFLDKNI